MATLSVRAHAERGTRTSVRAGRHTFLIDEPPLFGGEDAAPSPVELLLASLAGALNAIGQYVAGELSMAIRSLDIAVDGDCNADCFFGKSLEARAGFQDIRIQLTLDTDADSETVEKWEEQVRLRCPVLDNLTAPAAVSLETVRTPHGKVPNREQIKKERDL